MIKKQSPLQELKLQLAQIRETENGNMRTSITINEVVVMVESLLLKEQQTFSDIWDAGRTYCMENWYGKDNRVPGKTEFLNQYKP